MGFEPTAAQLAVLQETREAADIAEFNAILGAVKAEMNEVVTEIMGPKQPIPTTLNELRDLYLTVTNHAPQLTTLGYWPGRKEAFQNGIRLLATASRWFDENQRTGAFRVLTIEEVVEASKRWRAQLKAFGAYAFALKPALAAQFADVNSTGTIEEEVADLRTLNGLVKDHDKALRAAKMTDAFVAEGRALLDQAEGRDLYAILGLRNQDDAFSLRNQILTYATMLGQEARAAGVLACWDEPAAKAKFEAASFRGMLRKLKARRRGAGEAVDDGEQDEAEAADGAPAKPNGAPAQPVSDGATPS